MISVHSYGIICCCILHTTVLKSTSTNIANNSNINLYFTLHETCKVMKNIPAHKYMHRCMTFDTYNTYIHTYYIYINIPNMHKDFCLLKLFVFLYLIFVFFFLILKGFCFVFRWI